MSEYSHACFTYFQAASCSNVSALPIYSTPFFRILFKHSDVWLKWWIRFFSSIWQYFTHPIKTCVPIIITSISFWWDPHGWLECNITLPPQMIAGACHPFLFISCEVSLSLSLSLCVIILLLLLLIQHNYENVAWPSFASISCWQCLCTCWWWPKYNSVQHSMARHESSQSEGMKTKDNEYDPHATQIDAD